VLEGYMFIVTRSVVQQGFFLLLGWLTWSLPLAVKIKGHGNGGVS
jgi:hypothetical protein